MVTKNDTPPDDKLEALREDIARIGRDVSVGKTKAARTDWSFIGILIAALSGGGYYLTSVPPRVANQSDIIAAAKRNPEAFRPDPWTGTRDDDRMQQNASDRHREQAEILRYIENRLKYKADRLIALERHMESVTKEISGHKALQEHKGAGYKLMTQAETLRELKQELHRFIQEHK